MRSFHEFYDMTLESTIAVVIALRGRSVGVEDIVQEAYLRAFKRWEELADMDRPDLWVHKVALNLATSRLRRMRTHAAVLARTLTRRDAGEHDPGTAAVEFLDLLEALPRRQREAIVLRYVGQLPVRDIATVMGCADGTVKAHLHAGRQTLKASFPAPRQG